MSVNEHVVDFCVCVLRSRTSCVNYYCTYIIIIIIISEFKHPYFFFSLQKVVPQTRVFSNWELFEFHPSFEIHNAVFHRFRAYYVFLYSSP